jgi:hypothetical protein
MNESDEMLIFLIDMCFSFIICTMFSLFIIGKWGNIAYSPDRLQTIQNLSFSSGVISIYASLFARRGIQTLYEQCLRSKLARFGIQGLTGIITTFLAITLSVLQGVMLTVLLILMHYRYGLFLYTIFLILPYAIFLLPDLLKWLYREYVRRFFKSSDNDG